MKRLHPTLAAAAAIFALSGCASSSPRKAQRELDAVIQVEANLVERRERLTLLAQSRK